MGLKNDSKAVVDAQGRVYGVRGLRIVDASIIPLLPPGHPQATVCESCRWRREVGQADELRADALAEKIASGILNG